MDWLVTVSSVLIEVILVTKLSADQTREQSWSLGAVSALMAASSDPGVIQDELSIR